MLSNRAKSDDLERDSSSSRIFQNRNQRNVPPDRELAYFGEEVNDFKRLPQESERLYEGKNRIGGSGNDPTEFVRSEIKGNKGPHFEDKLKLSDVPQWDSNTDTIILWISKVNNLARASSRIHDQLGAIVHWRLQGAAENWYWSLPLSYPNTIEVSWTTLKTAISHYYMNRKWLDKQKARAMHAYCWEFKHSKETPSEYYICKSELLNMVYNLDDSELI